MWFIEHKISNTLLVNNLICHHKIDLFCLSETWLQQDYRTLNIRTPSNYLHFHIPGSTR